MRFIDLTGKKFGKLTVLKRVENVSKRIRWECLCDCGNTKIVDGTSIREGRTSSCGCAVIENNSRGNQNKQHGMTKSRPYKTWRHMIERCTNPNANYYERYGGRGIKVCDEWQTFEGFWSEMQYTYLDELTLDRIDNNGNYEKENCRWATKKTQARNRSTNRLVTFNGETQPMAYFAEKHNLKLYQVYNRLKWGWSLESALTTPVRKLSRRAK